jgi:hypothetical protein
MKKAKKPLKTKQKKMCEEQTVECALKQSAFAVPVQVLSKTGSQVSTAVEYKISAPTLSLSAKPGCV